MIHDDEWVPAKILLGLGGLPATPAGLHKRAKNEGWEKRAIRTPGVRGRAYAYRLQDLPGHVQTIVGQNDSLPKTTQKRGLKMETNELVNIIGALSPEEQDLVVYMLKRKGVESLISFYSEENQELIQLKGSKRCAALRLEKMSDEEVREILEEMDTVSERSTIDQTTKRASEK